MRLFVYGTLLEPARLRRLSGGRAVPRPARLAGWERVRLRGTPFPTLSRRFRGTVAGAVIDVDAATLRRMMAWEGPSYRLARLVVDGPSGKTGAFIWIAPAATRRPWP